MTLLTFQKIMGNSSFSSSTSPWQRRERERIGLGGASRGEEPDFLSLPPRCIFSFLPPFPRELRSFPIARGWRRGKEKKVFLIFRSGETFRSSPKEEEERRIANIQSLLFVREKLCRQGVKTFSVLCTVGFSYCAKKQGIRMWYTNVRMWVGWLDASCGCDSEREKRK